MSLTGHVWRWQLVLLLLVAISAPSGCEAAWYYRVINGNSTAGLLQVRWQSTDLWGTVCRSGFSEVEATVACRSIGNPGFVGTVVPLGVYGPGWGPILMSSVSCSDRSIALLEQCSYSSTAPGNCAHDTDVAIVCSLPPKQTSWDFQFEDAAAYSGSSLSPVLFRASASDAWNGAVCYTSDANVLNALCRQVGPFVSYSSMTYVYASSRPSMTTALIATACGSWDNITISQCLAAITSPSACPNGMLISVRCQIPSYTVRLVNGTSALNGLVQVRPTSTDNSKPWGTLCNNNNVNTPLNASVLCRLAGHAGTIGVITNPAIRTVPSRNDASSPIYFSNMVCSSTLTTIPTTSSSCTLSTNVSGCTIDMGVALSCTLPPFEGSWEFRSDMIASSNYATVLARPNATAPWGGVCSTSFNSGDTMIACYTIGYPYAYYGYSSSSYNSNLVPIYMHRVDCNAAARSLAECLYVTQSSCSYLAMAYCSTSAFRYDLSSGTSARASNYGGVLLVMPSAAVGWGAVCDDGTLTNDHASAICNILWPGRVGYVVPSQQFGNTLLNKSVISQLNCTGVDLSTYDLSACKMRVPTSSCNSVGIQCVLPQPQPTDIQFMFATSADPRNNYVPLQVRPNASAPWKPMCSSSLSSYARRSLCATLGYPTANGQTTTNSYTTDGWAFSSTPTCSPDSVTLNDCRFLNLVTSTSCNQAALYCYGSTPTYLSGPSANSGLLMVTLTSTPGTVCSLPSMSETTLKAACTSVGLPGYVGAMRSAGVGSGPILFGGSAVACPSNATQLLPCLSSPPSSSCTHANDVGLQCSVPTGGSFPKVKLVNYLVLVQLNEGGEWGTVCVPSSGLQNSDAFARTVCASIGQINFSSYYTTVSISNNPSPFLYDVVCANSANVTNMTQCTYSTSNSQTCWYYAGASCSPSWQYSLLGGSDSLSGRVAVRPSSSAPWGDICAFGASGNVGNAMCDAVGLSGYAGQLTNRFQASGGPVYQFNVTCSSNLWTSCTSNYSVTAACGGNGSIIGVLCSKPTPRTGWQYRLDNFGSTNYNLLSVRPSANASWGYVGGTGFTSLSAYFACVSVNPAVPTYASWYTSNTGDNVTVYMTNVNCLSTATSLNDCLADTSITTSSSNLVYLTCNYNSYSWNARLVGDGTTTRAGRLEVRPSSYAPWGSVCSTGLNTQSLCLIAGLYGLVATTTTRFGASSGPIYMSNVNCDPTTSQIGQCQYNNLTITASVSGCSSHSSDVGIECAVPPPPHWVELSI